MSLFDNFYVGGSNSGGSNSGGCSGNNSANLPEFIKLRDKSFALVNSATQWDDQITDRINPSADIIEYSLVQEEKYIQIPYANYKGKVWIKLGNLQKGKELLLKIYPSNNDNSNPDAVFVFYDNFDKKDNNKWQYANGGIDGKGNLKVNGGNAVLGSYTKQKFDWRNKIIEWNMYSNNNDFDSGLIVAGRYFISDKGNGSHSICTSLCYPSGSQQANKWNDYQIEFTDNLVYFRNLTVNKTVSASFTPKKSEIKFICDSDTPVNPLLVDYICVRERFDFSNLNIKVTEVVNAATNERYKIVRIIPKVDIIGTFQVRLPVDAGNYTVYAKIINPELTTLAFPPNKTTYIEFFTQFSHKVKLDSKAHFHLHTFIPPDYGTGKVKFKFEYKLFPVQVLVTKDGAQDIDASVQDKIEVEQTFQITENMLGKHVLFVFDIEQDVKFLSQIVVHRLTRLGDDAEDTYNGPIPILYIDWHAENDTLGSVDEFSKY